MAREGVTVHRPQRLEGEERTFLAPNGEGAQLFPRDGMIVIGDHVIDASLRLKCRQRERFGLRPIIQPWPCTSAAPAGRACRSVRRLRRRAVPRGRRHAAEWLRNLCRHFRLRLDLAGVDWLQALLGDDYRVLAVAMRSTSHRLRPR